MFQLINPVLEFFQSLICLLTLNFFIKTIDIKKHKVPYFNLHINHII